MKGIRQWFLVAIVIVVAGCSATPQAPVALHDNFWGGVSGARIAVVVPDIPDPSMAFPGANCLLCIAVVSGVHSKLVDHVKTFPKDDIVVLKDMLVRQLNESGAQAKAIDAFDHLAELPKIRSDAPNAADRDFGVFKSEFNATHVLVVSIQQIGAIRPIASYAPTDVPKASVVGSAYLVNVADNSYEWYAPLTMTLAALGEWDEPPKIPGLTSAYFQALAMTRDRVLDPSAKK